MAFNIIVECCHDDNIKGVKDVLENDCYKSFNMTIQ